MTRRNIDIMDHEGLIRVLEGTAESTFILPGSIRSAEVKSDASGALDLGMHATLHVALIGSSRGELSSFDSGTSVIPTVSEASDGRTFRTLIEDVVSLRLKVRS